jgi:hypothetical protein
MARASERRSPLGLDRRGFLLGAAGTVATWLLPGDGLAQGSGAKLPEATLRLLETAKFVYISPLRSDGSESTCHGEVWFGWLDGTVVINTRRGTWKAKALQRGLDRARIWVGDHGEWKAGLSERNEAFRAAPSLDARARFEKDRAVLDRLLALYEEKYGRDFARWSEDMRTGFYGGLRYLIRYEPL